MEGVRIVVAVLTLYSTLFYLYQLNCVLTHRTADTLYMIKRLGHVILFRKKPWENLKEEETSKDLLD